MLEKGIHTGEELTPLCFPLPSFGRLPCLEANQLVNVPSRIYPTCNQGGIYSTYKGTPYCTEYHKIPRTRSTTNQYLKRKAIPTLYPSWSNQWRLLFFPSLIASSLRHYPYLPGLFQLAIVTDISHVPCRVPFPIFSQSRFGASITHTHIPSHSPSPLIISSLLSELQVQTSLHFLSLITVHFQLGMPPGCGVETPINTSPLSFSLLDGLVEFTVRFGI